MRKLMVLAALAAAATLAGCSASKASHDSSHAAVVVNPTESGRTLNVAVGDSITFTAEENPSTAYLWTADFDGKVLAPGESKFEVTSKDPDIVGAPGIRTITFLVKGAGTTTLKLTLARAHDASNPAETVSYTVESTAK